MTTRGLSARLDRVQATAAGGTDEDVAKACRLVAAYHTIKARPDLATAADRKLIEATPWKDIQTAMGVAFRGCRARGGERGLDDVLRFAHRRRL